MATYGGAAALRQNAGEWVYAAFGIREMNKACVTAMISPGPVPEEWLLSGSRRPRRCGRYNAKTADLIKRNA